MTLSNIDKRLTLFKDYLHHILNTSIINIEIDLGAINRYSPAEILRIYNQTGLMFMPAAIQEEPYQFNKWLTDNNYPELVA